MKESTRPPWLGIELRHLAALSAVAREGSFRGAADELGYVQSAVSQQVAHLEQLVNARLVERCRGRAGVALTEAGEVLVHHFHEILARFAAAQADVDALRDGRAGRLRVGVFESVAARLMPRILVGLAHRLPGVQVVMHEEQPGRELPGLVEAGELDLAFGALPLSPGPFASKELVRDPYVLLVPVGWPLALEGAPVPLERLAGIPLIAHDGEPRANGVETELRARGIRPRYIFRSASNAAVQELVAAEIGAAVVPRLALGHPDERTAALELNVAAGPRRVAVYWHEERRRPSAVDVFVEIASRVCFEMPARSRSHALAA